MKKLNIWLWLVVVLLAVGLISCGDDDDDSPTGPALGTDVAGTWTFSGQLTSNSCAFLSDDPDFQIGTPLSDAVIVTQNNLNLTGVSGSLNYTGTVSGNSFSLVQINPSNEVVGGCTYSVGTGLEVNRNTEFSGTGTWNITSTAVGGDCSGLSLPCAVVFSGSWSRTL